MIIVQLFKSCYFTRLFKGEKMSKAIQIMEYCNMKTYNPSSMDYFLRKTSPVKIKPIIKKRIYFNRALKGIQFTNVQLIAKFIDENKNNARKIQRYIDSRFTVM